MKTAIVTGASQGIGDGIVKRFVQRDLNVIANSRKMTQSKEIAASDGVALVDGDIGEPVKRSQGIWRWSTRKTCIRVNAVAPGIVYTPLHRDTSQDLMESFSPMGRPSTVRDITEAVMYLIDAATVTGHILYVDVGAHFGRW